MSNIDFSLHNIPTLLSANKSEAYQDQVIKLSISLLSFMKTHNLLVGVYPFGESGILKEDFALKASNVTTEGLTLFKKDVPAWSAYIDNGGDSKNVSHLTKGLQKIQKEIKK